METQEKLKSSPEHRCEWWVCACVREWSGPGDTLSKGKLLSHSRAKAEQQHGYLRNVPGYLDFLSGVLGHGGHLSSTELLLSDLYRMVSKACFLTGFSSKADRILSF